MKQLLLPLVGLLAACDLRAGDGDPPAPAYVDEAPLPRNWPAPGPYGKVAEKTYPAYRAAFTSGKGEATAFWTLFSHIKRHGIPMTAPVEITMHADDDGLGQQGMAFLYQNGEVGTSGPDGPRVEVRDVPAARALSYAWQGPDSPPNVALAREALDAELGRRNLKATGFRMLGYNGPGTPRDRRTWELQALLE